MARIFNDITETVGNTPLVRLNRTENNAWRGCRGAAQHHYVRNLPV